MSLESPNDLVQNLINDKTFRDAYVYEHVKRVIPYQLRAMRKERDWKQGDMGKAVGKPRNVINRLENPNYGKLTLKTLFEIASGCNVALLVKFVPFSRLLKEYEDVSFEALSAASVTDEKEIEKLNEWAADEEAETIDTTRHFQVLEGGQNTTPTQRRLGFMYRVEDQDSLIRELLGRRSQSDANSRQGANNQDQLAKAASGR
ncbi:MAG TPA: helix-turn-helix transcriptional regulator [Pyrinomonadaceae bacterium]